MTQRDEAKKEADRRYYIANREKIKARVRARWRDSDEAKELDKACRDRKREKIRAYDRMRARRDRAKKKIIIERWIAKNPERHKLLNVVKAQRRRARIKETGGSFSADDVSAALIAQKSRCWWCSSKLKGKYHVDHRFPISKGGTNDASNIVVSCAACNQAKSAKMPWEFAGRLL